LSRHSSGVRAARRAFVLQGRFRRFFSNLGPGLITGAADDDPSGIATYSVTGAAFGYAPLWTAIFSFPLMAAIQMMCARLGMVTGLGLAGVIRVRYPRWILWSACSLLVIANIVNIAADLGGMADVTQLLTGVRSRYWTPLYALVLVWLLFWTSYRHIARIFKWLTLALFAYIAAALLAHPDWPAVVRATLVGILGTTISPYLFFWQAAQEVEEDIVLGKSTVALREGASNRELRRSRKRRPYGHVFLEPADVLHHCPASAAARSREATVLPGRRHCGRCLNRSMPGIPADSSPALSTSF
jgi:Mn2+/Fe2+ NRAMP family transporter